MAYATSDDLKEIVQNIDKYDQKEVVRGWSEAGGNLYKAANCGFISRLFLNDVMLKEGESTVVDVNSNGKWFYDSENDVVYYYDSTITEITNNRFESGFDWASLKNNVLTKASSWLDAHIDSAIDRTHFYIDDTTGTYDPIIVRVTALIAIRMLIESKNMELAEYFSQEIKETINGINNRTISLEPESAPAPMKARYMRMTRL